MWAVKLRTSADCAAAMEMIDTHNNTSGTEPLDFIARFYYVGMHDADPRAGHYVCFGAFNRHSRDFTRRILRDWITARATEDLRGRRSARLELIDYEQSGPDREPHGAGVKGSYVAVRPPPRCILNAEHYVLRSVAEVSAAPSAARAHAPPAHSATPS